jgi:hypothetical protein
MTYNQILLFVLTCFSCGKTNYSVSNAHESTHYVAFAGQNLKRTIYIYDGRIFYQMTGDKCVKIEANRNYSCFRFNQPFFLTAIDYSKNINLIDFRKRSFLVDSTYRNLGLEVKNYFGERPTYIDILDDTNNKLKTLKISTKIKENDKDVDYAEVIITDDSQVNGFYNFTNYVLIKLHGEYDTILKVPFNEEIVSSNKKDTLYMTHNPIQFSTYGDFSTFLFSKNKFVKLYVYNSKNKSLYSELIPTDFSNSFGNVYACEDYYCYSIDKTLYIKNYDGTIKEILEYSDKLEGKKIIWFYIDEKIQK